MRSRLSFFAALGRISLAAGVFAALSVAHRASAAVPVGWAVESTVDGGTSSLGSAIATTDTAAFVGAPFATPAAGGSASGAVFVFTASGGSWTSQRVAPPTPISGGNFGSAVAASGDLLAVGAPGTPPTAYVYSAIADGGYEPLHTWTDPASDGNQSFGGSIAVFDGPSAGFVAVAAPPGSTNPNGAVYVSRQIDGGAWSDPPTAITNASAQAFGIAVGFAGNGDLLVGDPGTGAGQVLVYSPLPDGGWQEQGTLPASLDGGSLGSFGNGIATWNDFAVVTAPDSLDDAGTFNGAALVFASHDGGAWTQETVLTGGPNESFGNFAPAITGDFVAVGSAVNTASSGAGRVDVWGSIGGQWVSVPSAALTGDAYYGQAVGVVGSTLFVGDTSALGAGSVGDVVSQVVIVGAVYADGGAGAEEAGAGESDGGSEGSSDGAGPPLDGSAGAAATGDGGGGQAGSAPAGSGCGCTTTGSGGGGGMALVAEIALAAMVWAGRRRTRRAAPRDGG